MVGEKVWLEESTWNRLEKIWKNLEKEREESLSIDEVVLFLILKFESGMKK